MKFSLKSVYNLYGQAIRNPKYRWWIIIGSLIYLLSPLDFAPDFIPIGGQIDDFVILTMFFSEVSQLVVNSLKKNDEQLPKDNLQNQAKTIDIDAIPMD
jgi:uncharacterized membrane protein YkvA (DUF1232 family)